MESLEKKLRTIRSFALAGALAVGAAYATGCEEESECCLNLTASEECDEMMGADYVCEDVPSADAEDYEEHHCVADKIEGPHEPYEQGTTYYSGKESCCACVKD